MFVLSKLPIDEMVEGLDGAGAVSLPLIGNAFRLSLLRAAEMAKFRAARESIGEGARVVYQRMEVCDTFSPESIFIDFRNSFQALWDFSMSRSDSNLFESPVIFNDLMLQRYSPGEIGITPHRDRTSYRNIICLFVLEGRGRFFVCRDRDGTNAIEIPNSPGDLILTRAPGCLGSGQRPFHFVREITSTRYVFGLRHEVNAKTP